MTQSIFDSMPDISSSLHAVTISKYMGEKESYIRTKLETAISKAVGFNNTQVINEIVNFVESKINYVLDQRGDDEPSSNEVSTGFINALIEGYLIHQSLKDKKYDGYLFKYRDNKIKKQNEMAIKVSHLYSIIKNGGHMTSLKKFSSNQTQIAASRYLLRGLETGEIKESIDEWFERIASCVVLGSIFYDKEIYTLSDTAISRRLVNSENYDKSTITHKSKNLKDFHINIIHDFYKKNIYHIKWCLNKLVEVIDTKLWDKYAEQRQRYKDLMYNGIFLPNTPTLLNAGTGSGGLSACFTLDVEDNMKSITTVQSTASFIYKMAGGLGVNVSKLRPLGSPVLDTIGAATGPINLVLEAIDKITDIVKAGGKRRGANMGIMEYWHPQILEFIDYKLQTIPPGIQQSIDFIKSLNHPDAQKLIDAITPPGKLLNFNISVMFDSDFWHHYFNDETINLVHGDKLYGQIRAKELIDKISENAWKSAEPGVLFKDNMNRKNPLQKIWGDIHITNPCSEQAMYDGESCTLGSINLAKFIDDEDYGGRSDKHVAIRFNFNDFKHIVRLTTRFLNDVLEINKYPAEYIEKQSNKTKRIGLGIMGFADMLFKMRIRFNSQEAYDLIRLISSTLYWESVAESKQLAIERGPCEAFNELVKSGTSPESIVDRVYNEKTFQSNEDVMMHLDKGVRNAWTTTIAPTGTISMIANCSNGLEPVFALVYKKTVSTGDYYYLNTEFQKALVQEGIYTDDIIKKVSNNYGSCQGIDEIPPWIQETFVTAMDLHWLDHLTSQAIWQQNIDNSISKTINMPHNATPSSILHAYILSHELGLKGVSVYRDGSRDKQVLHINTSVSSSNDKTIGVKAIVNKTIIRNSKPSEATMKYIRENIENPVFFKELLDTLYDDENNLQLFLKDTEECPHCNKGVLRNTEGCLVCNLCAYSPRCSLG